MTLNDLCQPLSAKVLCGDTDKSFSGVYVGDLLSRAMSRVSADNIWVTIMANSNTVAVATLTDPAAIILAENVDMPKESLDAATENDITVLSSPLSAYEICVLISNMTSENKK